MNEHDPQLEAALTATFARRDREVGQVAGDLTDVRRRAARRKAKRRTLTAVGSVAIVATGIGGLLAVGQIDRDDTARGAGGPATSVPSDGGSWYVCSGSTTQEDGSTLYDWCELESPYGNPAWSCTGQLADPATDGDDRPRFESCTAVGEAYPVADVGVCVPATTAPTDLPAEPAVPQTTLLEPWCQPQYAPTTVPPPCVPPTVAPTTLPAVTVPPIPTTTWVDFVCPMPMDPPPSVPESSVPMLPMTTAPVAPTTPPLPAESPRVFAIGDSVMLGASDVLTPRGWTVYAEVALQMADAVPVVEGLADAGFFENTVAAVIHLGTNGSFTAEQLDALVAPLADVPNVLLYTIRADRTWTAPNNALLRAADRPGDNITVIDWDLRSQECTDDCLAADGIHLHANGKQFYADLARDWTGV